MRIVLAYSGGLEGSAAIQWLRERHDAEIVVVTLDLGQGRELEAVRDRAIAIGAQRAHVLDARDRFARAYVLPALRADALHDGCVPMALALSRPLIAETLVEIAGIERADAVAHTGHASGGTSRLDVLLGAIAPALPVLTPAREWALSADVLAAFSRSHGLGALMDEVTRVEANFWGRSLRQHDVDTGPAPLAAPDSYPVEPAFVDIAFSSGMPTALNGVQLPLIELVASLATLTAAHGVGRSGLGNLWCEAPAAVLLHAAHRELTHAAGGDALRAFSEEATACYVRLVEDARWFSPLREGLDAYFSSVQSRVNGHVWLRVFRGEHSTITTELSEPAAQPAPVRLVLSSAQH
ncbi:MAG: argininosuccinate synthase domain-containing protein [Vicinamibacterales bacterium]